MQLVTAALLVFSLLGPGTDGSQDAATRAETLRRARDGKAATLHPYTPPAVERALIALENRRALERLLKPAEGLYPALGNVTAGSGFSFGVGYRRINLFGGSEFSAVGAGSIKQYWKLETRFGLPQLAGGLAFADVQARRSDFPEQAFFGLGPESNREDASIYGLRSTEIGTSGGLRPAPWLSAGGFVGYLSPRIYGANSERSVDRIFDPTTIPGFLVQPDFLRTEAFVDVNYREPRGNPRSGGQYIFGFQRFHDLDGGRWSFNRFEADLQQYISIYRRRRVLALRAFVSTSEAAGGGRVPFYLQRTLGGPDDLRGFRQFRFRDENVLLLQAEYRWEIFTAVDGAIFYDAGKVASTPGALDLHDLESDYGIGFRFGTVKGVFLRVEGAFGSSGGKHFILRFGDIF